MKRTIMVFGLAQEILYELIVNYRRGLFNRFKTCVDETAIDKLPQFNAICWMECNGTFEQYKSHWQSNAKNMPSSPAPIPHNCINAVAHHCLVAWCFSPLGLKAAMEGTFDGTRDSLRESLSLALVPTLEQRKRS